MNPYGCMAWACIIPAESYFAEACLVAVKSAGEGFIPAELLDEAPAAARSAPLAASNNTSSPLLGEPPEEEACFSGYVREPLDSSVRPSPDSRGFAAWEEESG